MKNRVIKNISAIISQLFFITLMLIGAGVIFHNVYFTPIKIVGASMEPTLVHAEFGIMDQHPQTLARIKRFDIIVVQQDPLIDRFIIKRLIGMPFDTFVFSAQGELFVDDMKLDQSTFLPPTYQLATCLTSSSFGCLQPVALAEDEFFVLGDNRGASLDSRQFGSIQRSMIIGKLIAIEGVCSSPTSGSDGATLLGCSSRSYQWPRLYV